MLTFNKNKGMLTFHPVNNWEVKLSGQMSVTGKKLFVITYTEKITCYNYLLSGRL